RAAPSSSRSFLPPLSRVRPTPTELHPLSLHDALPISGEAPGTDHTWPWRAPGRTAAERFPHCDSKCPAVHPSPFSGHPNCPENRSEEHTSELQSRENLVCRLLLEKKKTTGGEQVC